MRRHLAGRLVVFEARDDAEDAEDDLGVDAVLLHLLDAQMRVAGPRLAALAGFVKPGLGHLVDPVVLARDKLAADRADAAPASHVDAGLGHPLRPVRPLLDIGHAVLQLAAGLARRTAPAAARAGRDGNRPKSGGTAWRPPSRLRVFSRSVKRSSAESGCAFSACLRPHGRASCRAGEASATRQSVRATWRVALRSTRPTAPAHGRPGRPPGSSRRISRRS